MPLGPFHDPEDDFETRRARRADFHALVLGAVLMGLAFTGLLVLLP